MKAGYKVINRKLYPFYNAIAVINTKDNKIINLGYTETGNPERYYKTEIGVWKIKQLKVNN